MADPDLRILVADDHPLVRGALKQALQGIASQQGLSLSELDMHGGLTPAQDIVVHAGHVVMNQRIGMDQFNGAGSAQRGIARGCPHGLGAGQHQQGAQTLAPIEHSVSHGQTKICRGFGVHPEGKRLFHPFEPWLHPAPEIKTVLLAAHWPFQDLSCVPSSTLIWSSTA